MHTANPSAMLCTSWWFCQLALQEAADCLYAEHESMLLAQLLRHEKVHNAVSKGAGGRLGLQVEAGARS